MRSKIFRVMGVVVALAITASMLVVAPTGAAVGTLAWGVVSTPSLVGNVLVPGADIHLVAASADGKTIFAFDDTADLLYKSTNGGATFGAGLMVAAGTAVDLVVSPNYATDTTVALADATTVFASTNGGSSFVALVPPAGTGAINALDIGNYYADGVVNFIIGTAAGGAADGISNVQRFPVSGLGSWTNVGNIGTTGAAPDIGNFPVLDVKFSPTHASDGEILAVYVTGTDTVLSSHFGALEWNGFLLARTIVASIITTGAKIGLASDYIGNTGSPILIGLNGSGVDDVYRVTGRSGAAGTVGDLNVGGTGSTTSIRQLAVGGDAASGAVLWSTPGVSTLGRATGLTSFTVSAVSKQPHLIGGTGAWPTFGGTTAFVGTTGPDSAVSVSTDSGATWNGVGLVDVGTVAGLAFTAALPAAGGTALTTVDNNTMFIVMNNTTGGFAARQVWKTTDAGTTWMRIWISATSAQVIASPAYATDSTILLIDGTTLLQRSTNGGASFSPVAFPTGVSTARMIDGSTFFGGGVTAGALFKTGRFSGATGIGASPVFSIAVNPKDATKATLAVGLVDGRVYQSTNDGVSFTQVSTAAPSGASAIVTYGTDGSLYAAGAGGVARWSGSAWVAISAVASVGLGVVGDNTLYSADPTIAALAPSVGAALRSLKPTASTAAAAEFQNLNLSATAGFPTAGVGGVSNSLNVVGATADNTLYLTETTTAVGTFGYLGRVYGFKDTLAISPAPTAPANNALLTTTTTAALSWGAVTGATAYAYVLDSAAEVATAAATPTSAALAGLTAGSTHSWSFRVTAPLFSRQSASRSFTTALATVGSQPPVVGTVAQPTLGSVDVAIDATFTWTAVPGAVSYEFVIAEDLGETNKFAIIDYSATTPTNAHKLRENLKFNTTYWWRIRPVSATTKGDWTTFFFTTEKAPPEPTVAPPPTTTPPPTQPVPTIVITTSPPPEITLTIPPANIEQVQVIPDYLLWAVIAVGAILVIAVIILIVRTRRIS